MKLDDTQASIDLFFQGNTANCRSKRDLLDTSYRGDVHKSRTGRDCKRWDNDYSQVLEYLPDRHDRRHNSCRNPGGVRPHGAWCYHSYSTPEDTQNWDYCDIPACEELTETVDEKDDEGGSNTLTDIAVNVVVNS